VWATAQVLESANAAASAIAVSFMVVSFVVQIRGNCIITIKPLLAAGMADDAISISERIRPRGRCPVARWAKGAEFPSRGISCVAGFQSRASICALLAAIAHLSLMALQLCPWL
jgi:hypothetical protein